MVPTIRIGVGLVLVGAFVPAPGPSIVDPRPRIVAIVPDGSGPSYESFFAQVAQLKPAELRGQNAPAGESGKSLEPVRIQELTGLGDSEADVLNRIAADCVAAIAALQEDQRAMILESRLAFIETGEHPKELEGKINRMDERRSEMVARHVQQLQNALPEAQFRKLDAYVRSPPKPAPAVRAFKK
jgi:hypothetical protein